MRWRTRIPTSIRGRHRRSAAMLAPWCWSESMDQRPAWDAFSWACGEARRLRGRVVAIFVSSSASSGIPASCYLGVGPFGFDGNDSTSTGRADALRRELECYAADHDVDLTFVHTDGDAASELLRLATALHADQIVVGRSMKARHHLAGSLAGRLVGKRKSTGRSRRCRRASSPCGLRGPFPPAASSCTAARVARSRPQPGRGADAARPRRAWGRTGAGGRRWSTGRQHQSRRAISRLDRPWAASSMISRCCGGPALPGRPRLVAAHRGP